MNRNLSCPIIYIYFYKKLRDKAKGEIIPTYQVLEVLSRCFHNTPKVIRYTILEEMESRKMIKKINKMKFKVLNFPLKKFLRKYNYPLW